MPVMSSRTRSTDDGIDTPNVGRLLAGGGAGWNQRDRCWRNSVIANFVRLLRSITRNSARRFTSGRRSPAYLETHLADIDSFGRKTA